LLVAITFATYLLGKKDKKTTRRIPDNRAAYCLPDYL